MMLRCDDHKGHKIFGHQTTVSRVFSPLSVSSLGASFGVLPFLIFMEERVSVVL